MRGIGEVESEVGPIEITERIEGPEITVTGTRPPTLAATLWPWLIGAAVLGGLWWLTREDEARGPFARAAGRRTRRRVAT